jgi:superfamily II DNA or RNA helicase
MPDQHFFAGYADKLEFDSAPAKGLRRAQQGAIWALGSHWTVSNEPAQIVLPTGVGKTLVMTAAPLLKRARRTLVIAPSRVVRDQLIQAFDSFGDLKRAEALPADVPSPEIQVVSGKADGSTWAKAWSTDVVIGLPNSLSPHYPGVETLSKNLFDLVLVDEGHHVPAEAWRRLLEAASAPAAFFTATPFRADRRRIPGEVVFNYPLSRAIDDRVFRPVRFHAVTPEQGQSKDEALATAAIARVNSDVHQAAGSRLLVRAGRVEHAEALQKLYRDKGTALGLVLGKTGWRALERTFAEARTGTLTGLICVGSLTEGFDMPRLRIAAYHEPHKSLAPTLQFVGRLARAGPDVDGELLATIEDVGPETKELYREDAAWQELLPALVDAAVAEERAVRQFVREADWQGRPLQLPPLALRPGRSARIYRTKDLAINLDIQPERLGGADVVWRFYNAGAELLALVTAHRERPRWLHADLLDAWDPQLHIACHVSEHDVLFVASDLRRCLSDLRKGIGADVALPIAGPDLQELAWKISPASWFSIGLRPSRVSASSYEQVAGRKVEQALPAERLFAHSLGHGMAGGGGHGSFGFSVAKGKFWEPESTDSLFELRQWCEERAVILAQVSAKRQGLPGIPGINVAGRFERFPGVGVVAALMEHTLFEDEIRFHASTAVLHAHELELVAKRVSDTEIDLELLRDDEALWLGRQTPTGEISEIESSLKAREVVTGEVDEISELLSERPPIILFGDGASVQGAMLSKGKAEDRSVDAEILESCEWSGADITTEVGQGSGGREGVQQRFASELAARADLVLTDHGNGELADLIAITGVGDEEVSLDVVHVKGAKNDQPRRQLEDIVEVLTQAARSARWGDPAAQLWQELDARLDRRPGYCKFLHDPAGEGREVLRRLAANQPRLTATVVAVQPGLDLARVAGWTAGESLINLTADWCRRFGAGFRLVGSETQ